VRAAAGQMGGQALLDPAQPLLQRRLPEQQRQPLLAEHLAGGVLGLDQAVGIQHQLAARLQDTRLDRLVEILVLDQAERHAVAGEHALGVAVRAEQPGHRIAAVPHLHHLLAEVDGGQRGGDKAVDRHHLAQLGVQFARDGADAEAALGHAVEGRRDGQHIEGGGQAVAGAVGEQDMQHAAWRARRRHQVAGEGLRRRDPAFEGRIVQLVGVDEPRHQVLRQALLRLLRLGTALQLPLARERLALHHERAHDGAQARMQQARRHRLADEGVGARLVGLQHGLLVGRGAQHDDRLPVGEGALAQDARQGEAADVGQIEVDDDEIGPGLRVGVEDALAVGRLLTSSPSSRSSAALRARAAASASASRIFRPWATGPSAARRSETAWRSWRCRGSA